MNVIASYQVSVMMKHGKNCYKKETWTWWVQLTFVNLMKVHLNILISKKWNFSWSKQNPWQEIFKT
jgi:hypothetical protein